MIEQSQQQSHHPRKRANQQQKSKSTHNILSNFRSVIKIICKQKINKVGNQFKIQNETLKRLNNRWIDMKIFQLILKDEYIQTLLRYTVQNCSLLDIISKKTGKYKQIICLIYYSNKFVNAIYQPQLLDDKGYFTAQYQLIRNQQSIKVISNKQKQQGNKQLISNQNQYSLGYNTEVSKIQQKVGSRKQSLTCEGVSPERVPYNTRSSNQLSEIVCGTTVQANPPLLQKSEDHIESRTLKVYLQQKQKIVQRNSQQISQDQRDVYVQQEQNGEIFLKDNELENQKKETDTKNQIKQVKQQQISQGIISKLDQKQNPFDFIN